MNFTRTNTRCALLAFVLFLYVDQGVAQIITTIAGNHIYGYSGDGGPAINASISEPYGVAIDNAGNMLFSDMGHNVVRKVDVNGIITTFAGTGVLGYTGDGGPASAATLYHPLWLATDNAGNLYINDQNGLVIRKVNSAGIIQTIAGRADRTYYSPDGVLAINAYLGEVCCLKADNLGNLYFSDQWNHLVRKINSAGILSTVAGKADITSPGSNVNLFSGDGGPAINADLYRPFGIDIDRNGNLYIADLGNSRIRRVNTSGIITTIAGNGTKGYGGDGGLAVNAEFNCCISVNADQSGNIYVIDQLNDRIRKIDNAGMITTVVGTGTYGYSGDGGPATAAQIEEPTGATFDNAGNLIFADEEYTAIIRKVTICGQIAATSGASSLCIGTNTTLSNSSAGGTWSTNNSAVATVDATGKVSGISAGTAIISYTITVGNCVVSAPVAMTVNAPPSPASITGNQAVCAGDSISLNDATVAGVWSSSNTGNASIDATGKVKGISAGSTTITYQVSNACGSVQSTKLITVNPIPVVSPITGATQVCAGSSISLADPVPGGTWSTNNTAIATVSSNGVLTATSAGSVLVGYQVNQSGCTGGVSFAVRINPLPVVQPITGSSAICQHASSQLADITPGGTWSSGNVSVINTDQNGLITGTSTGSASVTYTITSSGCGSVAASRTVTVSPLPDVVFSLPTICLPDGNGSFVNASTISDGSSGLLTYLWDFGDVLNTTPSTLKNPTHRYSSIGPYFVKLSITSKDGCKDSLTQKLTTIYAQPKANFQLSSPDICMDQDISFTDNSDGMGFPISSYHWTFATGDSSASQNPVNTYRDSGAASASLYIINSQGCVSDTMVRQITVHPYPKLVMQNAQGILQGGGGRSATGILLWHRLNVSMDAFQLPR